MSGVLETSKTQNSKVEEMDLSQQKAGIYIITVETSDNKLTGKVIITE